MNELDYWTVDNSPYFGAIPGGLTTITASDAPICLHRGNKEWGETHINHGHGHWLTKLNMSAPKLVWLKCQQTGSVYTTESLQKFTIALSVSPDALMVLRFVKEDGLFTVVTIYNRGRRPDGKVIGRYVGIKQGNTNPVFNLVSKPEPQIIVKKPKRILAAVP